MRDIRDIMSEGSGYEVTLCFNVYLGTSVVVKIVFKIILECIVFTRDYLAGKSGFKNAECFILLSCTARPGQICPCRSGG